MRQPQPQTTAPLDTDPKWPDGYIEALRRAGAHEKNIPYCVSWVNRFFQRFPNRPRRKLGRIEIEEFLFETAQRLGVSNWQVQQARNSVETYYEKFRGIPLLPRTSEVCPRASESITSYEGNTPSSVHFPSSGSEVYSQSAPVVKPFQDTFHATLFTQPRLFMGLSMCRSPPPLAEMAKRRYSSTRTESWCEPPRAIMTDMYRCRHVFATNSDFAWSGVTPCTMRTRCKICMK